MDHRNLIKHVHLFCALLTLAQHVRGWKNVPEEFKEPGMEFMNNCMGKVSITEKTIMNARDFIFPEVGTDEHEAYKCYLKCIFEEMGIWENGVVDIVKAQEAFPANLRDMYRPNHLFCKDTIGTDECDTAYLTMECYKRNDPDVFFVI